MVNNTGSCLVVKRPGVLSKVQMLTLVLGVGVFSLLPSFGQVVHAPDGLLEKNRFRAFGLKYETK